mmetsp:Transcript_51547/g.167298  ORF Transcript_51547/g.167298 Transcript_51547/m.167298 type:complete len:504 (+) Transcript_51547:94-1605(+)
MAVNGIMVALPDPVAKPRPEAQEEQLEQLLKLTTRLVPVCSKRVLLKTVVGLLCAVVVLAYSVIRIHLGEKQYQSMERAKCRSSGGQIMSAVQQQLVTSVSSTKALAALVQLDLGANLFNPLGPAVEALITATQDVADQATAGTDAEKAAAAATFAAAAGTIISNASKCAFNNVVRSMQSSFKGITNLQLSPSGVVSTIHPIHGNEGAIGHDLFFDRTRRDGALATIEAGEVVFVGPLVLKQNNKPAIIARFPVFVDQPGFKGVEDKFPAWWGFTTMVTEISDLIPATPISTMKDDGWSFVLCAKTGGKNVFILASDDVGGQPQQVTEDPDTPWWNFAQGHEAESVEFELSNLQVHWVMMLWPKDGFPRYSDTFVVQVLLCICFSSVSLFSLYGMVLRESIIQGIKASMSQGMTKSVSDVPGAAPIAQCACGVTLLAWSKFCHMCGGPQGKIAGGGGGEGQDAMAAHAHSEEAPELEQSSAGKAAPATEPKDFLETEAISVAL